jgi:hypothetical protein
MGGERGTLGGELRARFWWGTLKDWGTLDVLGVGGRMILKCILKK